MIKRLIACLTICLIIAGLISPVYSHAEPIPIYTPNWNDPGIAEIINISDLTGWMANGGVYDITSFQNLDEFLTWYFKIRVPIQDEDGNITFAPTYGYDTYLDSNYTSPRFIEQSNVRGMIARSYQNKTGYGRRLQEQVDKALLEDGDLTNINIPLLNSSEAAFFVGYNTNSIDNYRRAFDISDNSDVNPDPNYSLYLDNMNGAGFWWKLYPNYNVDNPSKGGLAYYPCNSVSWFTKPSPTMGMTNSEAATGQRLKDVYCSDILDLYITSSNGTYTFNLTIPSTDIYWQFNEGYGSRVAKAGNIWPSYQGFTYFYFGDAGPFTYSYSSNSLADIFDYISYRFKNVNIYVDNECWSYVGVESDPIIPEFPDVVGGDELPTTTWPLTYPKAPSYINLPGLRQAFQRAKNTDNQFDIMDLTDSLVDPDGDPIEDPEMETIPIPLPNPDPINPEVVPELPDLPLIPPANNPGFTGVSVLAEIINFTNQSLPSALITVFWGIVFGAVILGIIKILHK